MSMETYPSLADVAARLERLRAQAPLVHSITNYVAMATTANALLAIGAAPAMVHAYEEAAEFVAHAGSLSINIGTLSEPWLAAMIAAATRAGLCACPWVLDPVAVGATAYRRAACARLMALKPTILRANASEVLALLGESSGKGVDATQSVDAAQTAADALARRQGIVVAVTGVYDYVTDGTRQVVIRGGHPLMPRVTALGCSASALVCAFAAVCTDPLEAAVSGLACLAAAGGQAGAVSRGPGSFAVALLDALAALDEDMLAAGVELHMRR